MSANKPSPGGSPWEVGDGKPALEATSLALTQPCKVTPPPGLNLVLRDRLALLAWLVAAMATFILAATVHLP